MPRPEFSQAGTEGGGQTVAVTNRPEIVAESDSRSTTISAGSSETFEIYAPPGSVYNLLFVRLFCENDGDWTSGSHQFTIRPMNEVNVLKGESSYQSRIWFQGVKIRSANTLQIPETEAGQSAAVRHCRATDEKPITVSYKNKADAAQENSREYKLIFEEESY